MSKILVYTAPGCPYCNQLKEFLKERKIGFEEINLGQKPDQAQALVKKTGQMGVPVTIIEAEGGEEKIIVGFDQVELSKAFKTDK